jgi:hypothetical protein
MVGPGVHPSRIIVHSAQGLFLGSIILALVLGP